MSLSIGLDLKETHYKKKEKNTKQKIKNKKQIIIKNK